MFFFSHKVSKKKFSLVSIFIWGIFPHNYDAYICLLYACNDLGCVQFKKKKLDKDKKVILENQTIVQIAQGNLPL